MTFLVVLLAYFFQQKLDLSLSRQVDDWVFSHRKTIHRWRLTEMGALGFLVLIYFIILILVFGFFSILEHLLWGVVALPLEVIVLLLCIGQKGYRDTLSGYLEHWNREEFDQAESLLQAEIGEFSQQILPPFALHKAVCQSILYHYFNRFFLIIFWFVLLGPAGAILVRLNDYLKCYSSGALGHYCTQFQFFLEWLPSRFLLLSFALVGDFSEVFVVIKRYAFDTRLNARDLINQGASAALRSLRINPELSPSLSSYELVLQGNIRVNAVRGLLSRSMVVWLSILAFLAIIVY